LNRDIHLDAAALFFLIGAEPCTTALVDAGVELGDTGFVVTRDGYATSVPGLFAVGDVRAGSLKRVASAVGEGSVVISAVHSNPGSYGHERFALSLLSFGRGQTGEEGRCDFGLGSAAWSLSCAARCETPTAPELAVRV
jgi:Pyridine nucleotide-disulphide oxidoreductase